MPASRFFPSDLRSDRPAVGPHAVNDARSRQQCQRDGEMEVRNFIIDISVRIKPYP